MVAAEGAAGLVIGGELVTRCAVTRRLGLGRCGDLIVVVSAGGKTERAECQQ